MEKVACYIELFYVTGDSLRIPDQWFVLFNKKLYDQKKNINMYIIYMALGQKASKFKICKMTMFYVIVR